MKFFNWLYNLYVVPINCLNLLVGSCTTNIGGPLPEMMLIQTKTL